MYAFIALGSLPLHLASAVCMCIHLSTAHQHIALKVIGAPLAAALLALDGFMGLRGWQWLFIVEGLPTIGMGVYTRFSLAESPATAAFLTPAEKTWLQQRHAESKVVLRFTHHKHCICHSTRRLCCQNTLLQVDKLQSLLICIFYPICHAMLQAGHAMLPFVK